MAEPRSGVEEAGQRSEGEERTGALFGALEHGEAVARCAGAGACVALREPLRDGGVAEVAPDGGGAAGAAEELGLFGRFCPAGGGGAVLHGARKGGALVVVVEAADDQPAPAVVPVVGRDIAAGGLREDGDEGGVLRPHLRLVERSRGALVVVVEQPLVEVDGGVVEAEPVERAERLALGRGGKEQGHGPVDREVGLARVPVNDIGVAVVGLERPVEGDRFCVGNRDGGEPELGRRERGCGIFDGTCEAVDEVVEEGLREARVADVVEQVGRGACRTAVGVGGAQHDVVVAELEGGAAAGDTLDDLLAEIDIDEGELCAAVDDGLARCVHHDHGAGQQPRADAGGPVAVVGPSHEQGAGLQIGDVSRGEAGAVGGSLAHLSSSRARRSALPPAILVMQRGSRNLHGVRATFPTSRRRRHRCSRPAPRRWRQGRGWGSRGCRRRGSSSRGRR